MPHDRRLFSGTSHFKSLSARATLGNPLYLVQQGSEAAVRSFKLPQFTQRAPSTSAASKLAAFSDPPGVLAISASRFSGRVPRGTAIRDRDRISETGPLSWLRAARGFTGRLIRPKATDRGATVLSVLEDRADTL